ncbi:hypothetical protein LguiA_004444 [Lonicera macranthoides]
MTLAMTLMTYQTIKSIRSSIAGRYKHNKKREDLQRLEELKKKGIISYSDSDSEESSEEEVPVDDGKKVSKLFTALIKIRNNDPTLKSKEAKLFGSDDDKEEDEQEEDEEESKRAVLDATAALDWGDDGGELLKTKEGKFDEEDDDGGETKKKLDEYFGEDDEERGILHTCTSFAELEC